jgi:hypothetical protein
MKASTIMEPNSAAMLPRVKLLSTGSVIKEFQGACSRAITE